MRGNPAVSIPLQVLPADPADILLSLRQTGLISGGLSRRTIYSLMKEGRFPRPVPTLVDVTGRTRRAAWVLADVLAFNRACIEKARGTK